MLAILVFRTFPLSQTLTKYPSGGFHAAGKLTPPEKIKHGGGGGFPVIQREDMPPLLKPPISCPPLLGNSPRLITCFLLPLRTLFKFLLLLTLFITLLNLLLFFFFFFCFCLCSFFYLLLLWLIPLLGLLLWYAFQQKRRDAAAFLDETGELSTTEN
ncbi:MAG: hypothetical protein LBH00_02890 [Planctomycetaceae bacterium]|jgi:hypothetical protein|nr:hypothetical protein [Planctomycetaceae bacterium]